jgi:hypothetical protein
MRRALDYVVAAVLLFVGARDLLAPREGSILPLDVLCVLLGLFTIARALTRPGWKP